MMHWGTYSWEMGLGWLYMIAFWTVIITAIVYLVKFFEKKSDSEVVHEPPLDTIRHRYAKGEITKEEFEKMKNELRKT